MSPCTILKHISKGETLKLHPRLTLWLPWPDLLKEILSKLLRLSFLLDAQAGWDQRFGYL